MLSAGRSAGGLWKVILSLLLVPGLVPVAAGAPEENSKPAATAPKIGDSAPEFSLFTLSDKEVKLSEIRKDGPVVLIVLRGWVGYQCPACTKQVGDFAAKAKQIGERKAKVVLVYPGPATGLKAHAEEFESGKGIPENFSFVLDPEMKFVESYGLRWEAKGETAYPGTFVVDKEGVVRFAKVSKSHGGRASAAEVLKALDELK